MIANNKLYPNIQIQTEAGNYALRKIVNAILHLAKTGCQWRMLPADFAPWKTVYHYFFRWKTAGIFEIIHEELVEKVRVIKDRKEDPALGIIDAQSIKNTLASSEYKGFDAGKKIKGIKRHIIVNTLGLVLAVVMQSASVQDRDEAVDVVSKLCESWKKQLRFFADGGYRGTIDRHYKNKV